MTAERPKHEMWYFDETSVLEKKNTIAKSSTSPVRLVSYRLASDAALNAQKYTGHCTPKLRKWSPNSRVQRRFLFFFIFKVGWRKSRTITAKPFFQSHSVQTWIYTFQMVASPTPVTTYLTTHEIIYNIMFLLLLWSLYVYFSDNFAPQPATHKKCITHLSI